MRRTIIWDKWLDPLSGGDEYVDEVDLDDLEERPEWAEEGEYQEYEDTKVRLVVPAVAGLIPIGVYGDWTKQFNFWMGHTSFTISKTTRQIVKKIPGVEFLDAVTRYRFRVGIGKCFDADQVREDIEEALMAPKALPGEMNPHNIYLHKSLRLKVKGEIDSIREKFVNWSVLLLPNGAIDVLGYLDDNVEDFEQGSNLHQQAATLSGGVVFHSNEIA